MPGGIGVPAGCWGGGGGGGGGGEMVTVWRGCCKKVSFQDLVKANNDLDELLTSSSVSARSNSAIRRCAIASGVSAPAEDVSDPDSGIGTTWG